MDEAAYRRITFDLTLAAARSMAAVNPRLVFCYVSGAGTDSSGRGRTMWARVKGETENALLALPFKAAYMFRPGYIQPMKGVRSSTRTFVVSTRRPATAASQTASLSAPAWKAPDSTSL